MCQEAQPSATDKCKKRMKGGNTGASLGLLCLPAQGAGASLVRKLTSYLPHCCNRTIKNRSSAVTNSMKALKGIRKSKAKGKSRIIQHWSSCSTLKLAQCTQRPTDGRNLWLRQKDGWARCCHDNRRHRLLRARVVALGDSGGPGQEHTAGRGQK